MEAEALGWLLERSNPSVRMFALTDVLGMDRDDPRVTESKQAIMKWRPVVAKRAQRDSGFWPPGRTSYTPKFTSSVWRLVLLGAL